MVWRGTLQRKHPFERTSSKTSHQRSIERPLALVMSALPLALPGSCDFTCSSSRSDMMSSHVFAKLPHVRRISISSILEFTMCHFPSRTPCASCPPFFSEKEEASFPQRQVPSAQRVQRTVEVPQIRDQTVEVARVIPQERIKLAGASASVRERVKQFEHEHDGRASSRSRRQAKRGS